MFRLTIPLIPYGTLRAGDIEGSDVEPTTLRADDFEGRRLWGQTTLRADDFEGRRLWGQVFCTLKIFALNVVCPQCRTTLRANIVVLEQFRVIRLKKIFALKVATLRAKLFWKTHQNPTWQNCQNFQKLSKILDIWCHHLGDECFYWIYAANFWKKYVILRVSVGPSGPGWGNLHFLTLFY